MTDYSTVQRRRNMIVGGFVIVGFCAFVWMVFIFGELPIVVSRMRSFTVMVNFPDVTGVQENTPVRYCGYQIGRVINVSAPFVFKDGGGRAYHQVKVTLAIDRNYDNNIPYSVDVKLVKRGLGSSYIEFFHNPDAPVERFLRDEDVLQGSTGVTSEFFPQDIQKKMEELLDSLDTLAKNVNSIIGDGQNRDNINKAITNIAAAAEQSTATLKSIQRFADTGSQSFSSVAEQLDTLLTRTNQLITRINEGQGTAGRFVNDARLYENLLESSEELHLALEQLRKLASEAREKGIRIKW